MKKKETNHNGLKEGVLRGRSETNEPFHKINNGDEKKKNEPPPDEDEDFLIEHVDHENALKGPTMDLTHLTDLKVTECHLKQSLFPSHLSITLGKAPLSSQCLPRITSTRTESPNG